jgi:hypothetical protein
MCGMLATTLPASAASDTTVEATFRKMIDPRSWMANSGEIDDVLGRMAEGPRFADLWEVERHYARVLQAWMTVRRRGLASAPVIVVRRENIARATDRLDELGSLQIIAELVTEARDVDVDRAVERQLRGTLREIEQLLARQHPAGALRERARIELVRAVTSTALPSRRAVFFAGIEHGRPTSIVWTQGRRPRARARSRGCPRELARREQQSRSRRRRPRGRARDRLLRRAR